MRRIPEPELMDDPAQAQAYALADFSEPHDAFVRHFRRLFPEFRDGRVIDLGCGAADVTIRFARAYPGAVVDAIDGAEAMLRYAHVAVAKAQLQARVRPRMLRIPSVDLGAGYDAVISNSLLHHLPQPETLWNAVALAAGPGASVLVMDLLRPVSREAAEELVRVHAADAPMLLIRDFMNSLLAAYRPDEVAQQLSACGLANLSVEAASDRHWLVWGHV